MAERLLGHESPNICEMWLTGKTERLKPVACTTVHAVVYFCGRGWIYDLPPHRAIRRNFSFFGSLNVVFECQ